MVCDEEETLDSHNLSIFQLKNCTAPVSPEKVLTIIVVDGDTDTYEAFQGKTEYPIFYAKKGLQITSDYIFLGKFRDKFHYRQNSYQNKKLRR